MTARGSTFEPIQQCRARFKKDREGGCLQYLYGIRAWLPAHSHARR